MKIPKFLTDPNELLRVVKSGGLAPLLIQNSNILFPVALLLLIGVFIVPVPTWLISILLVINLTISLAVLLISLYISTPLQLSSYPNILLVTTLFRLALSISCTRAILSHGDAGDAVGFLGRVTAGGDIVIGFVMFIILLVVQFIVVAKGAERVAEVAARFTLDAMPGKQMSIDADMRSGLISQEQALKLRSSLQRESQLYGAMDGAMKFVKGDSIATIIIALTNIIAGLTIGVARKGMDFQAAAEKYTILTIGDGLGAIFASLFIAISAGMVVTRVAADDAETSIGRDITSQMFANATPWWIITGLLFLLPVAGMPVLAVLPVAAITGLLAFSLYRSRKVAAEAQAERDAKEGIVSNPNEDLEMSFAVPLAIVVSSDLAHFVSPNTNEGARFRASLPSLRSAIYYDTGVMLPMAYVSSNAPIGENKYFIAVKEVPLAFGVLRPDHVFVNDSAENIRIFGLQAEDVRNPADLRPGAWIPAEQRHIAEASGLKVWEPDEVITLHVSNVLRRCAHEFIGIQEAQALLDFAARGAPKLVEEVIPKIVSIHQFTDVLQRLVQEGISIRDVKSILDALSEWGRIEKEPVMLTEYVRAAMRRSISFRASGGKESLFVYLLDPEIEDIIRGAIRRTSSGSFLALDPNISHDVLEAVRREVGHLPATAQKPIIITDMEIRRFVRKMVELEFPMLTVLSYQELSPELNIQPVGRITMRSAQMPAFDPQPQQNMISDGYYAS